MALRNIKIIQHNVLHWNNRRISLSNTYRIIDPEIILINSHGIQENTPMKIPGYRVHTKNTLNNASDGTAIAIKKNIQYKLLDDFLSDLLAVEISTTTGKIIISTLYQPPSRTYIPIPDFTKLFRRTCPVYMLADLNANHPNLGYTHSNNKGRQINTLIQNRLIQHVGPDFPTYYTHRRGTTPDIILTNHRTYHNTHAVEGPLTTSDHIPIIYTIATAPIPIPAPPRPNYNKANWETFKRHVTNTLHTNTLHEETLETIDTATENWHQAIEQAMQQAIPTTRYKCLPSPKHTDTTKLLKTLFIELQTYSRAHGWSYQNYRYYKQLQTLLHEALIQENREHWYRLINVVSSTYRDPTTFWKKIKLLTGNRENEPHYIRNKHNNKVYTDREKEEVHREYWQEIFSGEEDGEEDHMENEIVLHNIRNNTHRTIPYNNSDITRLNTQHTDTTITTEELKNIIKQLKRTSPGRSGINKTILTHLPDTAIIRLTEIFNSTISAGYFPDKWKNGIIRLIPKQNKSPQQAQNYRPITLLEVPGKILERVINSRLKTHLEINNLYNTYQFGFRSNRGTTQALAVITEQIAHNKSDKGQCQVILRDISKAFDQVWHLGLKHKILQLQLPITIEKFLCDFLSDRTASIKVNHYIGPTFNLNCGVPQGSVLSPTLFTIYTNDIQQPIQTLNISFADDITQIIGYPGRSKNMLNIKTERAITAINNYERNWKIKTNVNKFTPLHLGAKLTFPLIINEEEIEFKSTGKCLGLTITTGGYYKHIQERKYIAIASLQKLYKLHNMPEKIKIHLVKALILPILDYPPIPIHTMSNNQISKLQKVQNKALRFATNQKHPYTMTTEQVHIHTKTTPLNIRLHYRAKTIWEKIDDLGLPIYQSLKDNSDQIVKYHRDFPSSLQACKTTPNPIY